MQLALELSNSGEDDVLDSVGAVVEFVNVKPGRAATLEMTAAYTDNARVRRLSRTTTHNVAAWTTSRQRTGTFTTTVVIPIVADTKEEQVICDVTLTVTYTPDPGEVSNGMMGKVWKILNKGGSALSLPMATNCVFFVGMTVFSVWYGRNLMKTKPRL